VRRADRLFEIIQSMRRRGLVRARDLSAALEVSERTIYRDIQDLVASGVPIEGEAGVGYVLKAGFDLPPLMFKEQEIEAWCWVPVSSSRGPTRSWRRQRAT
jgi:predicted DNA-binding transcriptional regulator YafY